MPERYERHHRRRRAGPWHARGISKPVEDVHPGGHTTRRRRAPGSGFPAPPAADYRPHVGHDLPESQTSPAGRPGQRRRRGICRVGARSKGDHPELLLMRRRLDRGHRRTLCSTPAESPNSRICRMTAIFRAICASTFQHRRCLPRADIARCQFRGPHTHCVRGRWQVHDRPSEELSPMESLPSLVPSCANQFFATCPAGSSLSESNSTRRDRRHPPIGPPVSSAD